MDSSLGDNWMPRNRRFVDTGHAVVQAKVPQDKGNICCFILCGGFGTFFSGKTFNVYIQVNDYQRYDLVADYRTGSTLENELLVEREMQKFEKQRHDAGLTRRRIFRSAASSR